jgi:hypothetical protein
MTLLEVALYLNLFQLCIHAGLLTLYCVSIELISIAAVCPGYRLGCGRRPDDTNPFNDTIMGLVHMAMRNQLNTMRKAKQQ